MLNYDDLVIFEKQIINVPQSQINTVWRHLFTNQTAKMLMSYKDENAIKLFHSKSGRYKENMQDIFSEETVGKVCHIINQKNWQNNSGFDKLEMIQAKTSPYYYVTPTVCLFVSLSAAKTNDPKVFKLGIGNDLGIS